MSRRDAIVCVVLSAWAFAAIAALRPEPPPAWYWPAPPEPVHATVAKVAVGEVTLRCTLPAWLPETVERWRDDICAAAEHYDVDAVLVSVVLTIESGGDPLAGSHVGARSLMQIMPGTAREIHPACAAEPWDGSTSIWCGVRYLQGLLRSFNDPVVAAAAYNAGPGRVGQWESRGRALPPETLRYMGYVHGMLGEADDDASPTLDRWKRAGGARLLAQAAAR